MTATLTASGGSTTAEAAAGITGAAEADARLLPLSDLADHPLNRPGDVDQDPHLDELADSIRQLGVLERLQAAGHEPSDWEVRRLSAARAELAGEASDGDRWLLTPSAVDGWSLWRVPAEPGEPDEPDELVDAAGDDIAEDDVTGAQAWAAAALAASGVHVGDWRQDDTVPPDMGGPAWSPVAV